MACLRSFVQKGIAHLSDKKTGTLVNISGKIVESKNPVTTAFNWINNVSSKSKHEVEAAIKTLSKDQQIRQKAMMNLSIIGGIAYAAFMLGIGMLPI